MKIELMKVTSFEEHNEKLFYTSLADEKDELARRDFLKYLVVGSLGLLVPIGFERKANAYWQLLIPVGIALIKAYLDSRKPDVQPIIINNNIEANAPSNQPSLTKADARDLKCDLTLVNDGYKTAKGIFECRLKYRMEPDLAYETKSNKEIKAEVPKGYTHDYQVVLGNQSDKEGQYHFTGITAKDKKYFKYSVS